MKLSILFIFTTIICSTNIFAQDKLPPVDKSPMDMSYCPANFPITKMSGNGKEPLIARIIYSRPAMNGRRIFGGLIEFGKVWRVGANESTEIEFFKEVYIGNAKIKKGRYTLYAIPTEKKWTIILNKETDTWGAFTYDVKKDIIRFEVSVENITDPVESFTIYFDKISTFHNNYVINVLWESTKVSIPFSLVK